MPTPTCSLLAMLLLAVAGCERGGETGETGVAADTGETGDTGSDQAWPEMDALVGQTLDELRLAGMALAAVADGEVIWSQGYGWAHVDEQRPVTRHTAFMLASVSKTVTATALMQVVEDEVVGLDDSVDQHLPFEVDNPRVERETLRPRHLVSHTSGIRDNWANMPYFDGDSPVALGDYLEGYLVPGGDWYDPDRNFHPWEPGEAYDYSNIGASLAGYLVEASTGTPFDDWCDAEIFGPLGMEHTAWHLADFEPGQLAMPYEWVGGELSEIGHYGYPDYPDGQLRASAEDLGRFVAAVSAGGALGDERLLATDSVDRMLTAPVPGVDPDQYVLWYGFQVGERDVVGHNGGDAGVATEICFDPETGAGAVVLVNGDWTRGLERAVVQLQTLLLDLGESG